MTERESGNNFPARLRRRQGAHRGAATAKRAAAPQPPPRRMCLHHGRMRHRRRRRGSDSSPGGTRRGGSAAAQGGSSPAPAGPRTTTVSRHPVATRRGPRGPADASGRPHPPVRSRRDSPAIRTARPADVGTTSRPPQPRDRQGPPVRTPGPLAGDRAPVRPGGTAAPPPGERTGETQESRAVARTATARDNVEGWIPPRGTAGYGPGPVGGRYGPAGRSRCVVPSQRGEQRPASWRRAEPGRASRVERAGPATQRGAEPAAPGSGTGPTSTDPHQRTGARPQDAAVGAAGAAPCSSAASGWSTSASPPTSCGRPSWRPRSGRCCAATTRSA